MQSKILINYFLPLDIIKGKGVFTIFLSAVDSISAIFRFCIGSIQVIRIFKLTHC